MNYRRADNRQSPRHFGWSFLILAVVLLMLYFLGPMLNKWLFPPLQTVSQPILSMAGATGQAADGIGQFFRFKKNLIADNKKLTEENTRLKNLWLANRKVEQENVELKKLVGLNKAQRAPLLVEVLVKPITTPHDILLIDLGLEGAEKIKVGDKVGSGGGSILLGEVAELFGQTAKVKMYSTFGSQIAVSVGPHHIPGIAVGQGSGNFSLSLPRGTEVVVGDPVTASTYHDFLLGSVGAAQSAYSNPYLKVMFRLPVNIYELKWVEVYGQ
ncbi:MAG: rod shape-determining protein MreC [Candidatus Paceibacterota bacterium]|jgi:cell shape-determining protein MreC